MHPALLRSGRGICCSAAPAFFPLFVRNHTSSGVRAIAHQGFISTRGSFCSTPTTTITPPPTKIMAASDPAQQKEQEAVEGDESAIAYHSASSSPSSPSSARKSEGATAPTVSCEVCGEGFSSRNLLFKHLRRNAGSCGTVLATAEGPSTSPKTKAKKGQTAKEPKGTGEKTNKTEAGTTREPKQKRGKGAELTADARILWFGDIPQEFASEKRLKQILWDCDLPFPQPQIFRVIKKGYRENPFGPPAKEEEEQKDSNKKKAWLGYAFIAFRDTAEAELAKETLNGRQIEDADGISWLMRVQDGEGKWISNVGKDRGELSRLAPGEDPGLADQLMPGTLRTAEVAFFMERHRTHLAKHGVTVDYQPEGPLKEALSQLKKFYKATPRKELPISGTPLPKALADRALDTLRATRWPAALHRRTVRASQYLVLHMKIRNDGYEDLVQTCRDILDYADPAYPCTMVAVTKNYIGSPHIDSSDVRHQFAVSLGDFEGGGELCVESMEDCSQVFVVETKNRIAWADGRAIHWVRGYSGERFSLIFYCTDPAYAEPLGKSCDPAWKPASLEASSNPDICH
mmetsp:Transcript_68884/g.150553  ORF Transcript_68884/g.150553 Transcript_68884/m.150553 type:complete len:573 (-) Transcript_68884:21-1739(-)